MLLLPEIIGPLAVIVLLASTYGSIRSRIDNTGAQLALGRALGLVAMFQMNAPIEMVPGIILDMRNVPIALAGAFLGWRGALLCLGIAAATRFSIGGVGMPSGIAAMMIACAAGHIWNRCTSHTTRRGTRQFIVLSVLVSSHMTAETFVSWEVCILFFKTAALPMTVLNMLFIPVAATLLEHERLRAIAGPALLAERTHDPISGLASFEEFRRKALALARSDRSGHVTGILVVRTVGGSRLASDLTSDAFRQIQGAMRLRLQKLDVTGIPIAVTDDNRIVMSLDFRQVAARERIVTEARRILNDRAYHFLGGTPLRLSVSIDLHCALAPHYLEKTLESLSLQPIKITAIPHPRLWRRALSSVPTVTDAAPSATRCPEQERFFAAGKSLSAINKTS